MASQKCYTIQEIPGAGQPISVYIRTNTDKRLANCLFLKDYVQPVYVDTDTNDSSIVSSTTVMTNYCALRYPGYKIINNEYVVFRTGWTGNYSDNWSYPLTIRVTNTATNLNGLRLYGYGPASSTTLVTASTTSTTATINSSNFLYIDTLEYSLTMGMTWNHWNHTTAAASNGVWRYYHDKLSFTAATNSTILIRTQSGRTFDDCFFSRDYNNYFTLESVTAGGKTFEIDGSLIGAFLHDTDIIQNYNYFSAGTKNNFMKLFANLTGLTSFKPSVLNINLNNVSWLYLSAFYGTQITQIPAVTKLKADQIIGDSALQSMFGNCTKLVNIRSPFPWKGKKYNYAGKQGLIGRYGCYRMFMGCTGLQSIEDIYIGGVGTTGGAHGFEDMFRGCTSLKKAPRLLMWENSTYMSSYDNAFTGMFSGCTALREVSCLCLPPSSGDYTGTTSPIKNWIQIDGLPTVGDSDWSSRGLFRFITRGYISSNADWATTVAYNLNWISALSANGITSNKSVIYVAVYEYQITSVTVKYSVNGGTYYTATNLAETSNNKWRRKIPTTNLTGTQFTVDITLQRNATVTTSNNPMAKWPMNLWLARYSWDGFNSSYYLDTTYGTNYNIYYDDGKLVQQSTIAISSAITSLQCQSASTTGMTYHFGPYDVRAIASSLGNACVLKCGFGLSSSAPGGRYGWGPYGVLYPREAYYTNIYIQVGG